MCPEAVVDGAAAAVGEAAMNCPTVGHEAEALGKGWPICSRRSWRRRQDGQQHWDLAGEAGVEALSLGTWGSEGGWEEARNTEEVER
jgi:hypothetical protein